ncbi:MAG: hypothetical protein U0746_19060 [Gemmataceae bacterium]
MTRTRSFVMLTALAAVAVPATALALQDGEIWFNTNQPPSPQTGQISAAGGYSVANGWQVVSITLKCAP